MAELHGHGVLVRHRKPCKLRRQRPKKAFRTGRRTESCFSKRTPGSRERHHVVIQVNCRGELGFESGDKAQIIFIFLFAIRLRSRGRFVLMSGQKDLQQDPLALQSFLKRRGRTLLSAPARELNRVAVTTRRFKGSTAPTATSGVSTMATSLGGAVRIAARRRTGALPGAGVPLRGDGLRGVKGVVGVRATLTLSLADLLRGFPLVLVARDTRRWGVATLLVERPRTEPVRVRRGPWLAVRDMGELAVRGPPVTGADSPSCHWKCNITDLVAHWRMVVSVENCNFCGVTYRHLCSFGCEPSGKK